MKAKILVTLTLPVMLLAGCTTETYGLTQSEFRQVDKEFKADKMIKDMKQLHYSDEQIEKQLRMALEQLKYEEEMKKKENDKYKGIETEEDTKKDKKKESIGDNETVYEKKAKEKVTITEERYPYQLYEIYARLQYQIEYLGKGMEKSINERSATVNYTREESKLVDMQLNYILNLVPIGKYESNYPLLEEGVSKLREALELIVDFGMRAQNPLYPDNKLPEGFDKANDMIIDVLSTRQPIFDEIDKDFPDAKRKAEKKVERNLNDDTEGGFRIHKLNPKKVSREENNNDY